MRITVDNISFEIDELDIIRMPKQLKKITLTSDGYIRLGGYKLHQLIMGKAPSGMYIDHINGDRCDNRRENLRFVTKNESAWNRKDGQSKGTSKYLGVSFFPETGQWRARITVNKKTVSLGLFGTVEEAQAAYKKAKAKYHKIGA
jgi:HNH endonuclease/AP2 domain